MGSIQYLNNPHQYTFDLLKGVGVWLKMDNRCHSFKLFFALIFKNWGSLPSRLFCWRCLLTYFFPKATLFLSGGLRLIGHPWALNGSRFLRRNQFSLHQNYVCYLECLQEGNGLFGGAISCFLVKILNCNYDT